MATDWHTGRQHMVGSMCNLLRQGLPPPCLPLPFHPTQSLICRSFHCWLACCVTSAAFASSMDNAVCTKCPIYPAKPRPVLPPRTWCLSLRAVQEAGGAAASACCRCHSAGPAAAQAP